MGPDLSPLVIIETRSSQAFVVEFVAERFDQMQARANIRAQANHIAGVRRYLGLVEDDVKHARVYLQALLIALTEP